MGEKLRELRNERNLTMDELVREMNSKYKTNINKGMVSKWENNKGEPRLEHGKYLADFYGVSLDYIIGLVGDYHDHYRNEEIETIAAHNDGPPLTKEEQDKLVEYAKFLKAQRKDKK
jgi:transcriptional regulator with XRE-family HTH domain